MQKGTKNMGFRSILMTQWPNAMRLTIVGMEMCRDFFGTYVDGALCVELIDLYDKCGRQLYKLREAWGRFSKKKKEI